MKSIVFEALEDRWDLYVVPEGEHHYAPERARMRFLTDRVCHLSSLCFREGWGWFVITTHDGNSKLVEYVPIQEHRLVPPCARAMRMEKPRRSPMQFAVLVCLAIVALLASIACAMNKCPPWVPALFLSIYALLQQLLTRS